MGVRKLKAITPGQRFRSVNDFAAITTNAPEKSLTVSKKRSGGRNNSGKMTMRYIGGGAKQRYRVVDFKREKFGVPATVKTIEYDPNRSAFIALVVYADGEKRYIIAPNGLKVGQTVVSGTGSAPEVGNTLKLAELPLGTIIHNIELRPGQGGIIARSAGAFAQLAARDGKYATLKMPSGETRMILVECLATVGVVSNSDHQQVESVREFYEHQAHRRPK
jgi:large subunit ribosomal protein L2